MHQQNYNALAGNRTRASRVAGENSTTEPPVQLRADFPFQRGRHFQHGTQRNILITFDPQSSIYIDKWPTREYSFDVYIWP